MDAKDDTSGPTDRAVDSRCWTQMKWATVLKVHKAYQSDFRQFGYATSPYSNLHPRRGVTKDVVKHAQLGAQRVADGEEARGVEAEAAMGKQSEKAADEDGVSRCLKPYEPGFLEALVKHNLLDPKLVENMKEAVEAGRV
jgi:hypothetical protein